MKNETSLQNNPSREALLHEITEANRMVLLTHQGPDGDGLGAMFGLYHTFSAPERALIPATQSRPTPALTCIPRVGHRSFNPNLDEADRVITLDAGEPSRVEYYHPRYSHKTINIDHHPSERFAALNYLDSTVSSTSEILATMCLENHVPLPPEAATSFLVGIFFDTGGFQHQTTSATLWCVGKLLRAGGNLDRVVEYLNHSTGPEALQVWGYALQNLSIEDTPSLAHSRIPHSVLKKHNLSSKELQLDKLALLIGTISESSFGLLATEYKEGKHKGSFRTDAFKNVDVERIASQLGGGGHTYASGFRYDGDYAALLADIEQAWHNKEPSSVTGSVAE